MKKLLFVIVAFFIVFPSVTQAITKEDMSEMSLKKVLNISLPEGYSFFQGMTITENEIIVAAVKGDDTLTSLLAFDKVTLKQNLEKTKVLNLGHANDMMYHKDNNEIYVINASKIHVLDANTLEEKSLLDLPIFAISGAYDNKNNIMYLKGNNTTHVYDESFNELLNFEVKSSLGHQGMMYYDDKIVYTFSAVSENSENLEISSGAIYIYSNSGDYISSFYTIPSYGELEAIAIGANEMPYMLFNTPNGDGAIFIPNPESIEKSFEVKDETEDVVLYASLSDNNGMIENVSLKNEKYNFSPVIYFDTGTYSYEISRKQLNKSSSDDIIHVNVVVSYDIVSNQLKDTISYEKDAFEKLEKTEEDFDTIETPISNLESSNEFDVENPQTGNYFPFYILPIILGAGLVFVLFKRKFFFKL